MTDFGLDSPTEPALLNALRWHGLATNPHERKPMSREDEERLWKLQGGSDNESDPRMQDALVAWKVIGWKPHLGGNYPWQMEPPPELVVPTSIIRCVPHYTSDAAADYTVLAGTAMHDLRQG